MNQLLESEVRWAMERLANGKSPGTDNIQIELLKTIGDEAISTLTALCQCIWATKTWPEEWKHSVYVTIPKKGDARDCANNRTIALISHASKILLKIIQKRMEPYVERELSEEQAGFRRGRGCRDHIANIRWMMEKAREYQQDLFLCFIDYKKAFDCVDNTILWKALRRMGVPEHLTVLMHRLYDGQQATVRTEFGETDHFPVGKGVRQGCIMSPYLFNMYSETIMRNAGLTDMDIGFRVGGMKVNNIRYADDTTLISTTKEGLMELITAVKQESENYGLYLNLKKTKVMSTGVMGDFKLDDVTIEEVDSFTFLGTSINRDSTCENEIRRRIILGRTAMMNLVKIWKCRDVTLTTKKRIVKSLVFPVTLYGCEAWTIKKEDRRRIDAFELWCWRRMLRIPWTAKVTNKEVIEQVGQTTPLGSIILRQKLNYLGHVMRHDGMEKKMMVGMVEGSRRRGRQRMRWFDGAKEAMGMGVCEMQRSALDREGWCVKVNRVTRSRTRLDGT